MEIPVKSDQMSSIIKLNLVTKLLPVMSNFDYSAADVIISIQDYMMGFFECLYITSCRGVGSRLSYAYRILKVTACTKFQVVVKSANNHYPVTMETNGTLYML